MRLFLLLIFLAPHFLFAQDPVRDIDPTIPENRTNVEPRALPRDEIPGTIRETQQDHFRDFNEDALAEPQSSDNALADTTSIQFVDENGKVIRNPHAYTRKRIEYNGERRKAADTVEYFSKDEIRQISADTIKAQP